MAYLRWVTGAAGVLLIGLAIIDLDSVISRGPIQEEHSGLSWDSSQTMTFNLLPPLQGVVGFVLVACSVLWMRPRKDQRADG